MLFTTRWDLGDKRSIFLLETWFKITEDIILSRSLRLFYNFLVTVIRRRGINIRFLNVSCDTLIYYRKIIYVETYKICYTLLFYFKKNAVEQYTYFKLAASRKDYMNKTSYQLW